MPYTPSLSPARAAALYAPLAVWIAAPAAHALLIGNGAGALNTLAPSTARNVAISDGTDWGSRALVAADIPSLAASIITTGALALARGGTGVDLSAGGGATFVLAQDASHVISARALSAADIPFAAPGAIGATTPGTGAFTSLSATLSDSGTNAIIVVEDVVHLTSGTPVANYGEAIRLRGYSATSSPAIRDMGFIASDWLVATDTTRKPRIRLGVDNLGTPQYLLTMDLNNGNTNIQFDASGTGASAVAKWNWTDTAQFSQFAFLESGTQKVLVTAFGSAFSTTDLRNSFAYNVKTSSAKHIWYINDIELMRLNSAAIVLAEAYNIVLGTSTGTKIGTIGGASGQKLALWGATPVVQPLLATGAGHSVDDVITMLQTIGACRQS